MQKMRQAGFRHSEKGRQQERGNFRIRPHTTTYMGCKKLIFTSERAAQIHLARLIAMGRNEKNYYSCAFCGHWHITSRES